MITIQGKGVSAGVGVGPLYFYRRATAEIKRYTVEDTDAEWHRFKGAQTGSIEQLGVLAEQARKEAGDEAAMLFETHQMMAEDLDYEEAIEDRITNQKINAEAAVSDTAEQFAEMFASMDDAYMQARAADVKDVSQRILSILCGVVQGGIASDVPVLLAADDLAPSETVQLNKDLVLSFVTVHGSVNSHTAILARTMSIPALIGTDIPLSEAIDGKLGIVDGRCGCIYVDPDEETLSKMQQLKQEEQEKKELLQTLKGRENVTIDGKKIMLYANIGNSKDLAAVLQNDAGGIGLFRSEFIYLERETFPTEEEQFQIYRTVAETMAGKPVIIRTLDIGADKKCDYFEMEPEENPAMGCRAIRICLTRPEIFKTQLRALFRASAFGNISIMYPMIISVDELRKIKTIVAEIRQELTEQGVTFGEPKQGIMIETPAAVMMSEELAKEVDFFSIGTNDLTQYTLAIDRQNPKLDAFYDPHHPAVLRMIQMVVENAHKAGIWAGICGELGADTTLTRRFLAMGVDELSMSPGSILPVRKIILETDVTKERENNNLC